MAAGRSGVNFGVEVDLSDMRKQFQQIDGITAAEARKMVRTWDRGVRAMEKSAKKVGTSSKAMIGDLRKLGASAGGALGTLSARAINLGEVLTGLGPMGAAGIAVAGFGAVTVGALKLAEAVGDWYIEMDKASEKLVTLGLLTTDQRDDINDTATAVKALQSNWMAFKADIAASIAPEVEGLAESINDTLTGLRNLDTIEGWRLAIIGVAKADAQLRGDMAAVSGFQDLQDQSTGDLATSTEDLEEKIGDLDKPLVKLTRSTRDHALAGWDLVAAQQAAAKAFSATADEIEEFDESVDFSWATKQHQTELADMAKADEEAYQARAARMQDLVDKAKEDAAYRKTIEMSTYDAISQGAIGLADVIAQTQAQGTAGAKAAAMTAFRISQGLAEVDIAIKTGQAVMAALTVPPPAGIVLAAANLAAGVAAGVAVAAQSPPTFHTGGLLSGSAALQPDEVMIRGLRSEMAGILTAQGTQAAGGARGVSELNRGESRTPVVRVINEYQHNRVTGAFFEDEVRMTNSPLREAIRTSPRGRVGHRTRS